MSFFFVLILAITSVHAEDVTMTWSEWAGALHLATMWSFDSVRSYIIAQMDKHSGKKELPPVERIEMAIKCDVKAWLLPAYEELCTREEFLSADEANRLGLARSLAICKIRETKKAQVPYQCTYCRRVTTFGWVLRVRQPWVLTK